MVRVYENCRTAAVSGSPADFGILAIYKTRIATKCSIKLATSKNQVKFEQVSCVSQEHGKLSWCSLSRGLPPNERRDFGDDCLGPQRGCQPSQPARPRYGENKMRGKAHPNKPPSARPNELKRQLKLIWVCQCVLSVGVLLASLRSIRWFDLDGVM